MRPGAVLSISLSLCLIGVCTQAQQNPTTNLSLHDRVWIATQIYASVNSNFAHWSAVRGLDLQSSKHTLIKLPPRKIADALIWRRLS
jgi:hypothetical protein